MLQRRVYGEPAAMAAVAERLDALAGARHVSLAMMLIGGSATLAVQRALAPSTA